MMMQLNYHRKWILFLFIVAVSLGFLWFLGCQLIRTRYLPPPNDGGKFKQPSILFGRTDVVTVTPWLAPIVWEMTFDPQVMDSIYQPLNITIATTVFATGKYVHFLRDFLVTAEQHFFVGLRVHYYIFTDQPKEVPSVNMTHGRQLTVLPLPRWEQISTRRMELIQHIIETRLCNHTDYIFCLDVDSIFLRRWGAETLERLVAVVHPGYYTAKRDVFPYEHHPLSKAYVAPGEGDFYYSGGAFGGRLNDVHTLAKTCRENYEADVAQGVKAVRQEESYLNRYFLTNKPTKLLSPEYQWPHSDHTNAKPCLIRLFHSQKKYTDKRQAPRNYNLMLPDGGGSVLGISTTHQSSKKIPD